MLQKSSNKKIKYVNILITGDKNYNNLNKFNAVMGQIYNDIPETKRISTFGEIYGAEVLGQLYAQQNYTAFRTYSTNMFKTSKLPNAQLYHIMLDIAVKASDIVLIFSNNYTPKIKQLISLCKSKDKNYIIIKE